MSSSDVPAAPRASTRSAAAPTMRVLVACPFFVNTALDCTVQKMRLHEKTALVTGATSNIGRAIAVEFGRQGAHVVVSARDATRGAQVVREIEEQGGRADFVAADLDGTKAASQRLAEQATDALGGRIDILVNN